MKRAGNLVWTLSRLVTALALLGFIAAKLVAQNGTIQSPQAQAAGPQTYEPGDVYLPGSRVYVFVGKTGFGHEHGVVGQLQQGRIELDVPQNSGQLVFNMKSFVADVDAARKYVGLSGTTDASTQQQVTSNMQGPDVLDVQRYPNATFTVRSVTRLPQPSANGLPQYQLAGDFTLHGATQPIQVLAEAEEKPPWIHLRGGFTMQQTQFGITPFAKAFGAVGVTDQLKVWGDLWLSKERQVSVAAH
jgi:polyisoprenoid-binding protein YceI